MGIALHHLTGYRNNGSQYYIFILYSLILCSCLLIVSLLYILFPENISLFPLISWFVLYVILQAFTNQHATFSYHKVRKKNKFWLQQSIFPYRIHSFLLTLCSLSHSFLTSDNRKISKYVKMHASTYANISIYVCTCEQQQMHKPTHMK